MANRTGEKTTFNKWAIAAFCLFLGVFGVHRFIVGKIGTGILYLFTAGLLGIGIIVDLILILSGMFTNKSGEEIK